MIVQDADPIESNSIRAKADARAEHDVAFYLRRSFGNHRPDVLVFHDLRLEHEGEVAQIDHLVIHRHGMFIIETKSVSGELHVDRFGQFEHVFGRSHREGMESPVKQAERQADLLRRLLIANKDHLHDRALFGLIQGGFTHCPIEICVAISGKGIIRGAQHAPEVRKADLIPQDIEARIKAHRAGSRLLSDTNSKDGIYVLNDAERERLRNFLLSQHRPRSRSRRDSRETAGGVPATVVASRQSERAEVGTAPPLPPAKPLAQDDLAGQRQPAVRTRAHSFPRCHSARLVMLRGRYGYFLKCEECQGKIRLDLRVPGSGKLGQLHSAGRSFMLTCPDTGRQFVYSTNPANAD
jgi:hypothetical protein